MNKRKRFMSFSSAFPTLRIFCPIKIRKSQDIGPRILLALIFYPHRPNSQRSTKPKYSQASYFDI